MAEQRRGDQIGNNEARHGSNIRDVARRYLHHIKARAHKLERKVDKSRSSVERSDEGANHLKVCLREFHSLRYEFYFFEVQVDNCICDNPSRECRKYSCPPLKEVVDILLNVQTLIRDVYIKLLDEIGERKSMLQEVIRMVEALPTVEITDRLDEHTECVICRDNIHQGDCCHLPCNQGVIFHRNCLKTKFQFIVSILYQVSQLRSEIRRVKTVYDTERNKRADDFAFQLYMSLRKFESLQREFKEYKTGINYCKCGNRNPECKSYCDPLKRINHISVVILHLIRECLSEDLKERVETMFQRKKMEIVTLLRAINITDKHVNEKVECPICMTDFKVAENSCHLPCSKGHMFHRGCIEQWMKVENHCPLCRTGVYLRKYSVYHASIGRLAML
jgi:hypothetical protein